MLLAQVQGHLSHESLGNQSTYLHCLTQQADLLTSRTSRPLTSSAPSPPRNWTAFTARQDIGSIAGQYLHTQRAMLRTVPPDALAAVVEKKQAFRRLQPCFMPAPLQVLAHSAVDAAFAGFTGVTVGQVRVVFICKCMCARILAWHAHWRGGQALMCVCVVADVCVCVCVCAACRAQAGLGGSIPLHHTHPCLPLCCLHCRTRSPAWGRVWNTQQVHA